MPCQSEESHPWLQHPDGKWSPRPVKPTSYPASYKWSYEVDGYSLEAEREQINRWKRSSGWARHRAESLTKLRASSATVLVEVGLGWQFTVTMSNVIGVCNWQGKRSAEDFESLYHGIQTECSPVDLSPPPGLHHPLDVFLSPLIWSFTSRETGTALQKWLTEVIEAGLQTSQAFQEFAGCQTRFSADALNEPSNVTLSLPIMSEILSFLDEPRDLCHAAAMVSKSIKESSADLQAMHWERIYKARWPAFHEAQKHHLEVCSAAADWHALYASTLRGKTEFLLEVFEREKKLGFAMSAMMAKVRWEESSKSFIAHYISASLVLPERISLYEGYRLRYCPASVRKELKPELSDGQDMYCYRVLSSLPDLKKGQAVELQWRMQMGSPFGWWYGTVEAVDRHSDGVNVTVTLVFRHFPSTSRWHRLQIMVGDGKLQSSTIGGYHGGLRLVSEEEDKRWMRMFPKEPVIF